MKDADHAKVATLDELREEGGRLVVVDGEDVALFKRGGMIFAIQNVCAHQHFSKLHEGEVDGLTVTCPMHGWTYSLVTGKAINGDGKVRRYDVNIEGNDVYIESPRRQDLRCP